MKQCSILQIDIPRIEEERGLFRYRSQLRSGSHVGDRSAAFLGLKTLSTWLSYQVGNIFCYPGILLRVETGRGVPDTEADSLYPSRSLSELGFVDLRTRLGDAWVSRTTGRLRETSEKSSPLNRHHSYIALRSFSRFALEFRLGGQPGPRDVQLWDSTGGNAHN